jgi:hypothetical protein
MMEVTVEEGARGPRLGKPEALFEVPTEYARPFAVALDGEGFVLSLPATDGDDEEESAAEPGIKVVQSWIREFAD